MAANGGREGEHLHHPGQQEHEAQTGPESAEGDGHRQAGGQHRSEGHEQHAERDDHAGSLPLPRRLHLGEHGGRTPDIDLEARDLRELLGPVDHGSDQFGVDLGSELGQSDLGDGGGSIGAHGGQSVVRGDHLLHAVQGSHIREELMHPTAHVRVVDGVLGPEDERERIAGERGETLLEQVERSLGLRLRHAEVVSELATVDLRTHAQDQESDQPREEDAAPLPEAPPSELRHRGLLRTQ
ncbi:MAG: hypothetical protein S0880_10870 [Actinomycetota bacterium]|nr:hypothetical protein [Actinomycetota bacterium]